MRVASATRDGKASNVQFLFHAWPIALPMEYAWREHVNALRVGVALFVPFTSLHAQIVVASKECASTINAYAPRDLLGRIAL